MSGVYDLNLAWDESDWRGHLLLLEPEFGGDGAVLTAASPLTHVRAGAPPFLLLNGGGEPEHFRTQSRRFGRALAAAGNDVSYATLAGKTHYTEVADVGRSGDRATALIMDFVTARADVSDIR